MQKGPDIGLSFQTAESSLLSRIASILFVRMYNALYVILCMNDVVFSPYKLHASWFFVAASESKHIPTILRAVVKIECDTWHVLDAGTDNVGRRVAH